MQAALPELTPLSFTCPQCAYRVTVLGDRRVGPAVLPLLHFVPDLELSRGGGVLCATKVLQMDEAPTVSSEV